MKGEIMRRMPIFLIGLVFFALISGNVFAQGEDLQNHPSCKYCGMNRQQFAHSRVFIEYDDGSTIGTCSIHCAAIDLAINIDKTPKTIWVGDMNEKKLIDADKAVWAIGGSKMGVMTKRAKWAFEKNDDAEKFISEFGGRTANFNEAMRAAYEDMHEDTMMIRERRKMRKMQHKH
jgi:nitrous oxide reductase accessory protein NosL